MKKILIPFGLFFLLVLRSLSAQQPQPMTETQMHTWLINHWTVSDILPLMMDLDTLTTTPPTVTGPQMVSVLSKDGTLHVYWTSPHLILRWPDPNKKGATLLETTVPLPTLTQPNFYKPPGFPFGDVAIAGGIGLGLGVIGTIVAMLFIK